MKLIIVESPAKGRTLQSFLGKDYEVQSSYGHVRDLPKSKLGVDIEHDFAPQYIIPLKAKKVVSALKKESKKADETILATDEDREGEAIAFHLNEALELKNPKRIVFHEITKPAILEALKNPRSIDENKVNAQQARRVLDRLVGYKLSPFLWKKVARRLSAGRVQSVAVRLIAEREKEIQKFLAQEYWTIAALFKKAGIEFEALLAKKDGKQIDKFGIPNEKEAKAIEKDLAGAEYAVESVEQKQVRRNPLPPFTTSTLQQSAWQKLHFPARFTMSLAQQLYENGYITYHRTDSLNLSESSLKAAEDFIAKTYGKEYYAGFPRRFKTKSKGAQEAHEAVRPTDPARLPESLKGAQFKEAHLKLYKLVWQRFLASQMASALFDSTAADIVAHSTGSGQAKNYTFHATGQVLKFAGFLKVYSLKFQEAQLPELEKDEKLELQKLLPVQHFTEPPPRYTEATLVKALEEHGVGRPSTYAPIISTIQDRGYVEKDEQRKFKPTELGVIVNDLLVLHFPKIVDIEFTANMETKLDDIASGAKQWTPMIKEFYQPFAENLEKKYLEVEKKTIVEETGKTCPKCGSPLVVRFGKFGKFLACSKFPECKHTESIEAKSAPIGMKCPTCKEGDVIMRRTKKGRTFYGCSRYPDCTFASWQKPKNEVE
ncbi:MAG: type I DNA topoisomerase [Candidatus Wildermuthbacteria bacterium]|nr:type I DNA topoisomerase [Candidatus Wildermuthbacteria bacterium]